MRGIDSRASVLPSRQGRELFSIRFFYPVEKFIFECNPQPYVSLIPDIETLHFTSSEHPFTISIVSSGQVHAVDLQEENQEKINNK